jgi:hypothetical protein
MSFCGKSSGLEKCEEDMENRVNEKKVITYKLEWLYPHHIQTGAVAHRTFVYSLGVLVSRGAFLWITNVSSEVAVY